MDLRSELLPSPTVCVARSSDTTASKSWLVGVAAFHADLSVFNVIVSPLLPTAMLYALWWAR
jgi:hypothetical protein